MKITMKVFFLLGLLLFALNTEAQKRKRSTQSEPQTAALPDSIFKEVKLRNIGPGFMSGRIADLAIHPQNENIWYVAVGSGGVWKTSNAGVTFEPVFDGQSVYSIGCVTIDPTNPHVVWVGTGENVGGRHVAFGDGVYKSVDGGKSWKNMGLPNSEHISKIIVHPDNSDVVWVASQGPLWNKGGERGLYKSTDGGQTWKRVLGDDVWTGVTDVVASPSNPDFMIAATWDRHRTVAAYMGGGPGTALYRSEDGGETWVKLSAGLPTETMGKIGVAISYQNPDVIYANIELERRKGGLFKSVDRGSTWEKQSDAVSGGTGPHYYQELYASPHKHGRLYLMDNWMQVSEDGGKTFYRINRKNRHGDNHAIAFKMSDPNYLLVGTDGGVYESFDLAKHWRYMPNLPVTQYYKVAVDDTEPFYNIYGGTQDNSTQGGPSRTDNMQGISNGDWKIVLNWDGHQPATEPGNPNIMYAERQEGNLSRVDLSTGEVVDIQPQPAEDEDYERFNWDSPILVSPHKPSRIYFASQRVWRSENRGDSWTAISGDLTRNQERIDLPIMDRTWGWDAPWDVYAMSNYNTITSLAESPVQEDLFYAGTDDGLIQVTDNGGQSWRKIEVGSLPGVPSTAFVNDIKADLFDANTVYVALDNHKYGDYKPYLLKSTDKGVTWRSISNNLPQKLMVWRVVQDHVDKDLMFAGTEFGIYFTVNGGSSWTRLKGGDPTISFRDLAIQRRENDLVGASFGRGFFVLDDYSFLRGVSSDQVNEEATLFATRKAWWYIPRPKLSFDKGKGSQGDSYYLAPNPPFGAVFTYFLKDDYKSTKEMRQEAEKPLKKENKNVSFPGWDAVEKERREEPPRIWLTVSDNQGNVIRRIEGPKTRGFHRVSWDLRGPAPDPIPVGKQQKPVWYQEPQGMMAAPGSYTVSLSKEINGVITQLSEPVEFQVEQLREGALPAQSPENVAAFWKQMEQAEARNTALSMSISKSMDRVSSMRTALVNSNISTGSLDTKLFDLKQELYDLDELLSGNRSKQEMGEKTWPTVGERLFAVRRGTDHSTYGPTPTHQMNLEIANKTMDKVSAQLEVILKQKFPEIEQALIEGGAPWVEGENLPVGKE